MLKSFFFLFLTVLAHANDLKRPVNYGADPEMDACGSLAEVYNLSDGPDGFLAVKEGPNLKATRLDKILKGQKLWVCEVSQNGQWFGIVYPSTPTQECGVTSAIPKKKAYTGPCKSGWVSKKYINIIAG